MGSLFTTSFTEPSFLSDILDNKTPFLPNKSKLGTPFRSSFLKINLKGVVNILFKINAGTIAEIKRIKPKELL